MAEMQRTAHEMEQCGTNFSRRYIKGCFDRNLPKRIRLGAAWMKKNDVLLFYKILLPMCSVIRSVIRKDSQKYYYYKIDKWSNIYAAKLCLVRSYSNNFDHISINDMVKWDEVLSVMV